MTWKRYKGIFYDVFNPDTYTVENYKEFKKYLQINNQYIFIGSIVVSNSFNSKQEEINL